MSSNGNANNEQQEPNEEQEHEDVSVSIEYLRTLLQSSNADEQATAISTLSEFAQSDASMVEIMIDLNVHSQLMTLLSPFKDATATNDTIQGEEEVTQSALPCTLRPVLVNEILMTLLALCKDDQFFDVISPVNFGRVINIVSNEQYAKTCAVAVYTLLDVVGQMSTDLFVDIGDKIPFELPAQSEPAWLHAYLAMMHTLTSNMDEFESQYTKTVASSNLVEQIKLALTTPSSDSEPLAPIAKALMYGIVWNLCVAYRQPAEDDDDENENDDDDLNAADKQKTKEAEKAHNDAAATQFDWMGIYHHDCNAFMLETVSRLKFAEIQQNIDAFAATMNSDIEQCSDVKNPKKKQNEKDKNKQKENVVCIVDFEHIQRWTALLQQSIVDKIRAIRVLIELFRNIFDSDDLMLQTSATESADGDDEDEDEDEDDEEVKRRKKCILSFEFRNQLCGVLVQEWLNLKRTLSVKKLNEACDCAGLDYATEVQSMVTELQYLFSNLLYTFIRESVLELSTSQWQTLWNYCLERIMTDNSQCTQLMEQRKQIWAEIQDEVQHADGDDAEECKEAAAAASNGANTAEEAMAQAMAQAMAAESSMPADAVRDDTAVAYLCTMAIAKARDLSVTPTQSEAVLRLFARLKTCHESRIEHDLKMFGKCSDDECVHNCKPMEYFPIDLVYVDDIDAYYMDLHRVLINLCPTTDVGVVKRDSEQTRRILTALYDGVVVMAKHGEFIPRFVKQYKAAQNDENKLANWEQECAQCHGMDSLMLSFVTTQSILDVLSSSDVCAKLPMNKQRLREIVALYGNIQSEWKKFKHCVDEWNKKVETCKEDDKFDGIDWKCLDGTVSVPIQECLTNIEQFFKKINE